MWKTFVKHVRCRLSSKPQELFKLFAAGAAVLAINDAPAKAHVHV